MSKTSKKVAILGVSRETLMLARACALRDNPVVGIHDQDLEKALRAALFLGVSAFPTREELDARQPEIVVSSGPLTKYSKGCFHLMLGESPDEEQGPQSCSVRFNLPENEKIPEEILSEIPNINAELSGSEEAKKLASDFLASLSSNIHMAL